MRNTTPGSSQRSLLAALYVIGSFAVGALPAAATVAHDQTHVGVLSSNTITVSETTAGPGELLVAECAVYGTGVASISGSGLTWVRVAYFQWPNAPINRTEVWEAWAPNKLTSATMTISFGSTPSGASAAIESFTGASSTVGIESYGINYGGGSTASATVTTQSANALVCLTANMVSLWTGGDSTSTWSWTGGSSGHGGGEYATSLTPLAGTVVTHFATQAVPSAGWEAIAFSVASA